MKVLIVTKSLRKGGKERRLLELIKGLSKQDVPFEIFLISLSDVIDYNYVHDLPIKFEIIEKTDKDWRLIFRFRKIITEFRPDIIHSWDIVASLYLRLANTCRPSVLINDVIADAFPNLGWSDQTYFRLKLLTPFSKVIVGNSQAGLRAYNVPPAKGLCIYNGIDLRRFENLKNPAAIRSSLLPGANEKKFIGAMVASFEGLKDFETLISAATRLCHLNKDYIFLLIGGGSQLEAIKGTVSPDLLDRQIFFLGKRNDVEDILQIVDVGLLITPAEGISNAILETMASGKPVIATNGGGTPEVVKDGQNGFLIEQKNPDQIVEKMELLYADRELLRMLGENARKWVSDNFDLARMTQSYIGLYRKFSK